MSEIYGYKMKTPVAFFVFNRPDTTRMVFEKIMLARPPQLFIIADGPRQGCPDDQELCIAVRDVVAQVDWPCEVHRDYSEVNLGCRSRVASGLDWVFSQVTEAIILEDDCLPHFSFFRYCEELLDKYRFDNRVMMISGDNFQFGRKRTSYSYYFSSYPHIWGWASWRRAWQNYDVNMKLWPVIREEGWLNDYFFKSDTSLYWRKIFDDVSQGKIDTWDYQLTFACMIHHSLCILPNVNLVSNIGFGNNSTRTTGKSKFSEMHAETMEFPLRHPPYLIRDVQADQITESDQFVPSIFSVGIVSILKRLYTHVKGFISL